MATLKLAVTPDKVAKDGSHKIRIALGHKSVTRYIVTRFKIDHLSQFKNGQIVKRPDAAIINTKLRKKVCQNAPLLSFTHKAPTFTSWGFVIT